MAGKDKGKHSAAAAGRLPLDKGGKRGELRCVSYVVMPDGRSVPVDELTQEEKEQWQRRMLERLGENMSDYYSQHPELYARF